MGELSVVHKGCDKKSSLRIREKMRIRNNDTLIYRGEIILIPATDGRNRSCARKVVEIQRGIDIGDRDILQRGRLYKTKLMIVEKIIARQL